MVKYPTYIAAAIITLFVLIFSSCRSAKYLDEHQALVTKIEMEGVPTELKESAALFVSNEIRPNSPMYLTIYNLFNTSKGRYKTKHIKNVGEAPRILDSAMMELSANQISRFLMTKGYLDAQVSPQVGIKNKKATINFQAAVGHQYMVRNVERTFADTVVRELFDHVVKERSPVRPGKPYAAEHLYNERELLYVEMKNWGYFDYLRQYMRVGVDTIGLDHQADLIINVSNPSDSTIHRTYTIDSAIFRIVKGDGATTGAPLNDSYDSVFNIRFQDFTGKYRLRPLARYAFLRKGDKYNLGMEDLSYDRLYETNGFRSVKINYEKLDSTSLQVAYELIPRPAMSNQVEGEFTFSSGMSGFNIANTYSHRNIFGGAELLEIRMRYGVLFDPRIDGSLRNKMFNNDFQIGASLIFPRILVPFRTRSVGVHGLPRTTISSSLQYFFQDQTYANRYFINTLNYSWKQQDNILHSYTPLVLEYREGRLNTDFANRLIDQGYLLYVQSNDRQYFGLGSQYAITFNGNKLDRLEDFSFVRGMVDVSGNTLGVLANIFNFQTNELGERLVFNVPYLQYIKAEFDYRWYKYLGGHRQFVARVNSGLAVPYGNNSELLIFEKSFFAGGMNGIRAWQARTLGPGAYSRAGLSEDLRLNLRNLDQLGEVKLEANAEFRFRMLNSFLGAKLNGATFVDAGNVWRLKESQLNPKGEFRVDQFLSQIAIGTGFGVRLDMDYFTIRLDAGLKVKDPQFEGAQSWVIRHLFDSKSFRDDFYVRHRPDRYNFIQYNFGVGMPF